MAISDLPDAGTLFQEYLGGATVVALEVKYDVSHSAIYKRLRALEAFRRHCEARRLEGKELRRRKLAEPGRAEDHGLSRPS